MATETDETPPDMYENLRQDLESQVADQKLKKVIVANGILYTKLENGKEIGYAASTPEMVIMVGDTVYLERAVPDEQFIGTARVINGTSLSTAIVNGFKLNSNAPDGQSVIDFTGLTDDKGHLPKALGFDDVVFNLTATQKQKTFRQLKGGTT